MNINGHDFNEIRHAFRNINHAKKPTMIIADTIKGKGVSFMERDYKWHGKAPKKEEAEKALAELRTNRPK